MNELRLHMGKRRGRFQSSSFSGSPPLINLDDEEDFVGDTTDTSHVVRQLSALTGAEKASISVRVPETLTTQVKLERTRNEIPWDNRDDLLKEAQKKIKKMEDDADKLKKENKLLQRVLRADELEMELAVLKEAHEKLKEDFNEKEQQIKNTEKETRLADQEYEMKKVTEELLDEAQQQIMKMQKDADKLKKENELLLLQAGKAEKLEMELDVLKKELEEESKDKMNLDYRARTEKQHLTDKMITLEAENREKETLLSDQETRLKKLKEELDDKTSKLEKATSKMKNKFGFAFQIWKEKKDLQLKLEKNEADMVQVLIENSGLKTTQKVYRNEVEELKEKVKHLEQVVCQSVDASSMPKMQPVISILNITEELDSDNSSQAHIPTPTIVKKKAAETDLRLRSHKNAQEGVELMKNSCRITRSENEKGRVSHRQKRKHQQKCAGLNLKQICRRQPDGLYHCPFCPKKFSNRVARYWHKQTHGPKFVCKLCNRGYSNAKSLQRHLKTATCKNFIDVFDSHWKKYLK